MPRTLVIVLAGGAGSRLGPVVRCGATVARAMLDERTEIGAGARVGHRDGTITVAAETELDAEDDQ